MTNKVVKVYGPERSFTNYWLKLLELNFPYEKQPDGPWKHGDPEFVEGLADHYHLCMKNPYGWLVSYLKGFYKGHLLPQHYEEHGKYMTKQKEKMHEARNRTLNDDSEFMRAAMQKYMILAKKYDEFYKDHKDISYMITYEEVLSDRGLYLSAVSNKFDIEPSNDNWVDVDNEVITGGKRIKKKYDTSYWTEKRYLADLNEKQIQIIHDTVDFDFLHKAWGYEKEDISTPKKRRINVKDSINLVAYGDWSPYTGFGRVMRGIFRHTPESWNIRVMGINYHPAHPQEDVPDHIRAYSVKQGDNPYGPGDTLQYLKNTDFDYDAVFTLQDSFLFAHNFGADQPFIQLISNVTRQYDAKHISYTPIDAPKPYPEWLVPWLKAVDKPVTYTDWAKRTIEREVDDSSLTDPLEVIYHGTDPKTFHPLPEEDIQEAREDFDLPTDAFLIFYLGANQRRKDIPRSVLMPFALLRQRHSDAFLMIKTDPQSQNNTGWDLAAIRRQISEMYNIPINSMPFIAEQNQRLSAEHLNLFYNAADCLYLPSLEGWGLPVTEAYCARTPTIVGNHGATGEIGNEGRSLLVDVPDDIVHKEWLTNDNDIFRSKIDPYDFPAKVNKLRSMTEGQRESMLDKAEEWANQITWPDISKKWQELIKETV